MKKILFVHAKGGVPLDHAIPRMAAHGELHMLAVAAPPDDAWRGHCAQVIEAWSANPRGEDLVELIVATAKEVGADAVIGFSEYVLLAVSLAAGRLGLPGPGDTVRLSRDKRLMRERWVQTGVPIPAFRRVGSEADLLAAFHELAPPVLLKPAWGAGSVGQRVLHAEADVAPAWQAITGGLAELAGCGLGEYYETGAPRQLLIEEIIAGSVRGWYDEPGLGDYLSVEGIVAAGEFHPIAITGRIPTIPPFTELSSHAPTALDETAQRRIEALAKKAVDALDLDTCGTHTEIKLCQDGTAMLIESAARFGGSAITGVVESVFGVDMVGMLTRQLLGEPVDYPEQMLTTASSAAAEMSLIGTDAAGRPWQSAPVWDSRTANLASLVSPGSTITHVTGMTAPDGTVVPRYDEARGITNCIGMLFLTALDRHQMLSDIYAVLNGLERRLVEAMADTPGQE
ncbi:MAG: ATP-grasp domain-containing protein [Actinobacteria bacterium]|nr:ATP-grasp domain-containing protein [Actinomycetota bacterium]